MTVDILISFLVFAAILVVVFYGMRWLLGISGIPAEVQRIVMIILGILAIILFLVRFVRPLLHV